MGMLKTLATNLDMTTLAATTGVQLNETPFFPGGNAILRMTAPIGGAGVIQVQGSTTLAGTYTTLQSIVAADGTDVEITNLPKFIRLNKSTVGTDTLAKVYLEGVQ